MRSFITLIGTLPAAQSLLVGPHATGSYSRQHNRLVNNGISGSCSAAGASNILFRWHGGKAKAGLVRRRAGNEANMDESDDLPDDEMYASLRKRLEELEGSASPADRRDEPPSTSAPESFSLVKEAMGARSNTARSGSRPPQEQEKSLALVTIQSVGLISVSLAAVTFLLYWFAGPSFVHLGPRSYPVKSSVIESGVSRNGAGIVGTDGDAAVGITGTEKAPRLIGGGTREAFKFEGFPEVARSKP